MLLLRRPASIHTSVDAAGRRACRCSCLPVEAGCATVAYASNVPEIKALLLTCLCAFGEEIVTRNILTAMYSMSGSKFLHSLPIRVS